MNVEEKTASEVTLDEVLYCLGQEEAEEFVDVMRYVNKIIDNPESISGLSAIHMANRLAALRLKIGLRAQHYKAYYSQDKSMTTKRRKYLTETMYHALEENINTLKLLGRVDAHLS
jgi:hypothetical protein